MGAVRQLVDELRRRGVTLHEWPGWDGRGNADGGVGPRVTQIDPVGAVIHHTGSNYGSAYAGLVSSTRPELRGGCLCNFAGNEDGSLTVIASGLAWHAGPGVGPSLGRVLSKIPNIRNRMNRLTVGLEIVYPGNAPMRPAQYRTACVFAAAVADLFGGGDLECVRAHAETNGNAPGGSGKWDPGAGSGKTIDMAAFRRDAAQIGGRPSAAFQEDPDMRIIQQRERGIAVVGPGYYKGLNPDELHAAGAMYGAPVIFDNAVDWDRAVSVATGGESVLDAPIQRNEKAGGGVTTLRAQTHWADYNLRTVVPEAVAKVVGTPQIDAEAFASQVAEALAGKVGLSREDVKSAMGEVLIQGAGTTA